MSLLNPARTKTVGARVVAALAPAALVALVTAAVPVAAAPSGAEEGAAATGVAFSAPYTCTHTYDQKPFDLQVDATVTATRTTTGTALSVSTGQVSLPVAKADVQITSTLASTVDAAPVTLTGTSTVTVVKDVPFDVPTVTGTSSSTAGSVTFVPGALTMDLGGFGVPFALSCQPKGTAPSVVVATATAAPTPGSLTPVVKASLSKKVQRVGKAPARVRITVAPARGRTEKPTGTFKVTVGKRVVATVTAKATRTVPLPRNLKPGRHRVTVTFTPTARSPYKARTVSVQVRVKR